MKKKPFLIFGLFLAVSLLFVLVYTLFAAKTYRVEVPNEYAFDASRVHVSAEKQNVEITDVKVDEDTITVDVRPLRQGTDFLEISSPDTGDSMISFFVGHRFYSGPLKTLFVMEPSLNFNGSGVVIAVFLFDIVLTAVFMTVMYLLALRRAAFSYSMVACGGIALFVILNLGVESLFGLLSGGVLNGSPLDTPFGTFVSGFASSGVMFSYLSAPFMAAFSIAVTASNLVLIRKEGFQIFHLLGAILGVAWLAGMGVSYYFDANASGSSEHGRIFTSITSAVSIGISYFVCMLFATVLSAWLASRHRPPFDRDYIVILGCAIRRDGSLTPLLRGRVDAALAFARRQQESTGRSVIFVPSGGQGSDEVISESEAMKRYLLEQGVDEARILCEDRSVNTLQNVQFSKNVIEAHTDGVYRPAVATTNYHVFRSYVLAQKAGLENMQGISAKTKWYFFPNAFLREMAGLIVDKMKVHLLLAPVLMIAFGLINALSFFG